MKPQSLHRRVIAVIAAVLVAGIAPVNAADYLTMSGQQLYTRFCASCHGSEGHGDGPAAHSFAVKVPDLTVLARNNAGKFPRDGVERAIDGRHKIASHGAYTMPVWGEDFSQIGDPNAESTTRTMIARLVDYLETIQH